MRGVIRAIRAIRVIRVIRAIGAIRVITSFNGVAITVRQAATCVLDHIHIQYQRLFRGYIHVYTSSSRVIRVIWVIRVTF